MTRDIIDINDFTVLVEESSSESTITDSCYFDEPVIGVAFYGAGDVNLTVRFDKKEIDFHRTKGLALSFYANEKVEFKHTISSDKPLQCVLIATAVSNLEKLPNEEGEIFEQLLHQLVNPSDPYVEGPQFFMTPTMQMVVDQVFDIQYEGKTKMMFFRSQMTTLLSHFFGQLATMKENVMKAPEREKLYEAKQILLDNMDTPPSLTELSRLIGLNSFKLKKNFKALFGVPVFKYLQNERLTKAHELLRKEDMSIQEAAWHVGYDSLSSFSNAFAKKYGFRPSEISR
ncbi:AraC family transcriptional regulator [Reichenbachiella sp.]|uniref:helix-turn-helix transcriptional regulator n=1 Tax=Reichenbachiella sp. TaxID=2184521 RepID=UPI0032979A10